ncbi:nitrate ABC transporter ATP-binding protein (plasmid) [Haloarcula marismortui ATCC 33800]|uniref:Nitrate ABC transporter ATP-binding protein n=2 Tax=Haloarcula TaxID=2237 RepID=A0A8T8KQT5_9EURY|nr:nitrate ABC transporter ATP-binding protein [Haloarcula sinaiiensis ATCC 33800]
MKNIMDMADRIVLLGFAELAIDLVEPATVKKPIDHVYCISVLLDMLRLSQKELMCFTLGEFVSA